jgi:hypothetical protein
VIISNLIHGGRAALYDLRHLTAFGIRTVPFHLPDAANGDQIVPIVVRPDFPRREP